MRKPVVIAGAVIVISIYIFYISPSISTRRTEITDILGAKYITLKKYEKFIKGRQVAETELKKALNELAQMEKNIMQATDPSVAFAKLQSKIQDIADGSEIKILSIKTRQSISHGGYTELPMEIEGTGYIKELSEFLKSLDSGRFIKIERLDITSIGLQQEGPLRIRMQISGLMKT